MFSALYELDLKISCFILKGLMLQLVVHAVISVLYRVNQMSKYELVKQGSWLCYFHVFQPEIMAATTQLDRLMKSVNKDQ